MKKHVAHFLKLRLKRLSSERLDVQFFFGVDEDHYQLSGSLNLDIGEWQSLGCALSMGLRRMVQRTADAVYIPIQVTVENQMRALGRADELAGKPDVTVYPTEEDANG